LIEDADKRILILIPCSLSKNTTRDSNNNNQEEFADPLPGIKEKREKLLNYVRKTEVIASKEENIKGILNPRAPRLRALDLYTGRLYKEARYALRKIANSNDNYLRRIEVLIVSAFYGLVKLNEGVKLYNLTMTDKLNTGYTVYRFWKEEKLWEILENYIFTYNIAYIWSLLPTSNQYPYHHVFDNLWEKLKNNEGDNDRNKPEIRCFHVKPLRSGSDSGRRRGVWLREVIIDYPEYLSEPTKLPEEINGIKYEYIPCYDIA